MLSIRAFGRREFSKLAIERTGYFTFIVLLLSFAYKYSVPLPYGAVGQSSVCVIVAFLGNTCTHFYQLHLILTV